LQLEGIEQRTTEDRRPQRNGIVERFHRISLYEHFRIQGARSGDASVKKMQTAPECSLRYYNQERLKDARQTAECLCPR
jgi:hypothetical protein